MKITKVTAAEISGQSTQEAHLLQKIVTGSSPTILKKMSVLKMAQQLVTPKEKAESHKTSAGHADPFLSTTCEWCTTLGRTVNFAFM